LIDVLVQGSLVLTGSEAVRDGYVYISGGRVAGVGSGVPPEEYTRATLVLGGEGRIVAPALTLAADAAAYPFRILRPGRGERARLYKALGVDAAFHASLPAVYELHIHGVATVVVEFVDAALPSKLAEDVGGFYGLLLPCEDTPSPAPAGLPVTRYSCDEEVPGFLESPLVYRPSNLARPWEASQELRRRLGLGEGGIREGVKAEIAVFNAARPPGMLLDRANLDLDTLYSLGLTVESLIAGEDVVVDRGEHLYITDTHLDRARSLSLRLLQEGGAR